MFKVMKTYLEFQELITFGKLISRLDYLIVKEKFVTIV